MLQQFYVRRRVMVGLIASVMVGVCAMPGLAETKLRWKFTAGETTRYEMKMDMNQSMNVAGNAVDITTNQLINMTWKVDSVAADGSAKMTQTIDRMRMEVSSQGGGVALRYDSADKKKPEGLAASIVPIIEGLVGKPFTMKITPRGEVSDIKFPQGMLDAFKKSPGMEQIGGMFTEDGFKQMAAQSSLALPADAVSEGKTWESASETKNPVLGTQKLTTTYTYQGTESKDGRELAKIGTDVKVKIVPGDNATIKIDVKEQDNKGTILFDNAQGRIVQGTSKGVTKMEISVMGMSFDQQVKVDTTLTLAPAEEAAEKK